MEYRIRRGDTLWALAKRFGTTVEDLARTNNIRDPDRIIAGDTLRVPDGFDRRRPAEAPTGEDRDVDPTERRRLGPTGPAGKQNGNEFPRTSDGKPMYQLGETE